MMGRTAAVLRNTAGLLIAAAAVAWTVKATGGAGFSLVLRACVSLPCVLASAALLAGSTFVRSLVYPCGLAREMPVPAAWKVVAVGNAANLLLPFHAGEGVRFALFPKGTRAAERLRLLLFPGMLDIAVILILSMAAVPLAGFRDPVLLRLLRLAAVGFPGVCLLLLAVLLCIPAARGEVLRYLDGAGLRAGLWVALSWALVLLSNWMGVLALGYRPEDAAEIAAAVFAATGLAMLVPSSPGGIGVYEYAVVAGLGGLGVPADAAGLVGVTLHFVQYLALLPLGAALYFLPSGGFHPARRKPSAR